jgi:hypothetical protein
MESAHEGGRTGSFSLLLRRKILNCFSFLAPGNFPLINPAPIVPVRSRSALIRSVI